MANADAQYSKRRHRISLHHLPRILQYGGRFLNVQDVADHLQIGWDTIKEIQASHLQRKFGKPKLRKLTQIAIDEINIGKGHRYLSGGGEAH